MASANRLNMILGQDYNDQPLTPREQVSLLLAVISRARGQLSHITPWNFIEYAQEKWGDSFDGKYIGRLSQAVQYDGDDFTAETKLLPLLDHLMASEKKVPGAYAATSYFRRGLVLSRDGKLGIAVAESTCSLPYDAAQRGLDPDPACEYVEQVPTRVTLALVNDIALGTWLQEDPGLLYQALRALEDAAKRYCDTARARMSGMTWLMYEVAAVRTRLPKY